MKGKIMSVLKIILLVILCLLVLIIAGLVWLSSQPAVPNNYTQTVKTGGKIENSYLQNGTYEVSYNETKVMQSFEKYEIWYPKDIENTDTKYPVVIFANGTGVKASKYSAVMEHLASWGFVVMATEEEYSWNAFGTEMCLRYAIKLNEQEQVNDWESNPFLNKLDMENIGVFGHSQGGVGVINAATNIDHSSMIKAVFAASPTQPQLAIALEWDYDASRLNVPTFLTAATGNTDSTTICPLVGLQEIYDSIPESTPKLMCRINDGDHGNTLYYGDGYMTAWFMYWLKGDTKAGNAFWSENAEIFSNQKWQDVNISLGLVENNQ